MKQKIVIQVSINGDKRRCKSKAMTIAVAASGVGVESVSFKDDKSQIEVTGDGLDATVLTQLLRKKVGHADLLSVGPAGGEKKPDKPQESQANIEVAWPNHYTYYNAVPWYEVQAARDPSICSIM